MAHNFRLGIDIGSTTVKAVLLNSDDRQIYSSYQRHNANIQETLAEMLEEAEFIAGTNKVMVAVCGSGGITLAKLLKLDFVQEVIADHAALERFYPGADVAVELGGEDAKIIYFTGGLDQRMNSICAGGTGAFIDQMAALMQTDADGLNEYAKDYKTLYTIAARCGVFAKSDIQPLINEGATREDLAASIFQAVVNQTVSGLACGKPICGNVAFLGGPLHFLDQLREAFIRTLKLTPDQVFVSDDSHLFAAIGTAMQAKGEPIQLYNLASRLRAGVELDRELLRLQPLFEEEKEYKIFQTNHAKNHVRRGELSEAGNCFLGIDAGSTTTKLALIDDDGRLLWSFYSNNNGSPVQTVIRATAELNELMPPNAHIARACSTGYGEALIKAAFLLDESEVETIAHYRAATFFEPDVDCILDIGGQDMKCIKLKDGVVDTIMLNEACSSGCGSFIESFANSMGYTAEEFAKLALFAKAPVDLGTRCTVFMNSNVKQAQKEGASIEDISSGLAYSVIKNALYKVIKLTDASELGNKILVQGGTFLNDAVLRVFENISGMEVIRPDISGIMGAFGTALIAKDHYKLGTSSMLSFDEIAALQCKTSGKRCGGCTNNCLLTVNHFDEDRRFISGNRCERAFSKEKKQNDTPNLFEYKLYRVFDYEPLSETDAPRGIIGLPRVLNMYEDYPYWAILFRRLGFRVVLSPLSSRKIYELGMDSIPSETECYPAKLAHGHVQWLLNEGVKTIFYPCVISETKENPASMFDYNCPIVATYAENVKNNIEGIKQESVRFLRPFISFKDEKTVCRRMETVLADHFSISAEEVRKASRLAWQELEHYRSDIQDKGIEAMLWIEENNAHGIVLAGRPYHADPEINHGIPEMIRSYGFAVLTEDSISHMIKPAKTLRVSNQWLYHSRLYSAAEYVSTCDELDLIQLNSFGCGIDAVTTDQVAEILNGSGKIYTVLKIDEVNNLGAARIRVRSLLASLSIRNEHKRNRETHSAEYHRSIFSEKMYKEKYTILAPQMSPIHFSMIEPVFRQYGMKLEILKNDNREAIECGLKYVNNDACFPSITVVGQIMHAVNSGKYDLNRLAIIMTQTGGGCRASNYVGFIRRALEKDGLEHIPVISFNLNGMEKNPGLHLPLKLILKSVEALIYGDLFMQTLYRVRPYELVPNSANKLHEELETMCVKSLTAPGINRRQFRSNIETIVDRFDKLPINEGIIKPRVAVVGEVLVKYMPLANNNLVDLLELEGAEAVVPDMVTFFEYMFLNSSFKYKYLGGKWTTALWGRLGIAAAEWMRRPVKRALEKSRRFTTFETIDELAALSHPMLSMGNQCGEGWFLSGEMAEMLHSGVENIVCVQPFACLPNHVVGKGVIRKLREIYPGANIVALDFDPGASEVNQLNRIKLMLSNARKPLEEKDTYMKKQQPYQIQGELVKI